MRHKRLIKKRKSNPIYRWLWNLYAIASWLIVFLGSIWIVYVLLTYWDKLVF